MAAYGLPIKGAGEASVHLRELLLKDNERRRIGPDYEKRLQDQPIAPEEKNMKKLVFLALICLCLLMVPAASAVTFVDGNGNLVNIDAFGNVTLLSRGAAFAGSYTTAGCPVGVGYGTFTSRALVGSARIGGNSVTIINNQVPVVAQMPGSVAVAGRRGVAVADGLGGSVAVAGRRGGVAVSGGAGSVAVAGRRRGVAIAGGGGTAVAGRRRGVAIAR